MYEENSSAKKIYQTIILIKNLLFLDNRFLLDFLAKIINIINY